MKKSIEEIKDAAVCYAENKVLDSKAGIVFFDCVKDFIAGDANGYARALDESAEEFEDVWLKGEMPDSRGFGGGTASPSSMSTSNRKKAASFCFQAAKLSSQKELADKDAKIKELEEKLKLAVLTLEDIESQSNGQLGTWAEEALAKIRDEQKDADNE